MAKEGRQSTAGSTKATNDSRNSTGFKLYESQAPRTSSHSGRSKVKLNHEELYYRYHFKISGGDLKEYLKFSFGSTKLEYLEKSEDSIVIQPRRHWQGCIIDPDCTELAGCRRPRGKGTTEDKAKLDLLYDILVVYKLHFNKTHDNGEVRSDDWQELLIDLLNNKKKEMEKDEVVNPNDHLWELKEPSSKKSSPNE